MTQTLDRSNCGIARSRGKEAAVKLVSRRTERPYKADGADKLAQHSKVRCLVPEVNGPVAQGEFTSLLREICAPGTAATPTPSREQAPGAAGREVLRVGTEVSRSHSTGRHEPGHTPEGLTTREGPNLADSTTIAERRQAMKPNGGAGSRVRAAEKECCLIRKDCQEPPDADPHVRWCGGREVNPPAYPIRHHTHFTVSISTKSLPHEHLTTPSSNFVLSQCGQIIVRLLDGRNR